jgi:hypothetical protein
LARVQYSRVDMTSIKTHKRFIRSTQANTTATAALTQTRDTSHICSSVSVANKKGRQHEAGGHIQYAATCYQPQVAPLFCSLR